MMLRVDDAALVDSSKTAVTDASVGAAGAISLPPAWAAILQHLLRRGTLSPAALERAQRLAQKDGAALHVILTGLGLVSDSDLAQVISAELRLPRFSLDRLPALPLFADEISPEFLLSRFVLPLAVVEEALVVAAADPTDTASLAAIAAFSGLGVSPMVATVAEIEACVRQLYNSPIAITSAGAEIAALSEQTEKDAETLRELGSEAPVIRFVQSMMERAVASRASDVHIEPADGAVRLRFRIDGLLRDVEAPPFGLYAGIVSRVKIMARLNYAERRRPQDGRLRVVANGREYDFRVSILPATHGESVAIRVLDRHGVTLDFEQLGFTSAQHERLMTVLDRPSGMVLLAGPTGSGKTTTLYAALQRLNNPTRKILTVEDPVEYPLPGIVQMQVDPAVDVNFANVLRSFLRHDPDVIMVGEIRDAETARIAIQAALTGHLVVSTVHANSASATVTRLRDMGLEPYLIAATLNGVVSQRLVRRLCQACAEPYEPESSLATRLGLSRFGAGARLWRPRGCPACDGAGFRGRIVLAELLELDDALRDGVTREAQTSELERLAREQGFVPLAEDGLEKCVAGLTTLDEVARVTLA